MRICQSNNFFNFLYGFIPKPTSSGRCLMDSVVRCYWLRERLRFRYYSVVQQLKLESNISESFSDTFCHFNVLVFKFSQLYETWKWIECAYRLVTYKENEIWAQFCWRHACKAHAWTFCIVLCFLALALFSVQRFVYISRFGLHHRFRAAQCLTSTD